MPAEDAIHKVDEILHRGRKWHQGNNHDSPDDCLHCCKACADNPFLPRYEPLKDIVEGPGR